MILRTARGRLLLLLLAGAALLIALYPAKLRPGDVAVHRGSLEVSVAFVGQLEAQRSDTYPAEVPGVEQKILWLADEGSHVRAGDPLIRFDPSSFERELAEAADHEQELKEEAERARLAVEAQRLISRSSVHEAGDRAEDSRRELLSYVNSEAPLTVEQAAHDLEQKQRDSEEAEQKLEVLTPFAAEGFVSQDEVRTARARRDQSEADLRLARAKYEALVHHTGPDTLHKKTVEAGTGQFLLQVANSKSRLELEEAEAASRLAIQHSREAQRRKREAAEKIARCQVRARASGLVVYGEIFDKAGQARKVRVGDSVWGGTTVVQLPDMTHLVVRGDVPESALHWLTPGLPASVRLDAFPELVLSGALRGVGALGASESAGNRSFPVRVEIATGDPRFRPGMTARSTILCAQRRGVLLIPVEAVRVDAGGESCVVAGRFGSSRRGIHTGARNASEVEVVQGLSEGDVVRLSPD